MKIQDIRHQTSVVLLSLCCIAAPLAAQTSLSIYSDGRMVVRKTLPQRLEKGRTTLALYLGGLDPATLFSPDTSVAVVSALLVPTTDPEAAMRAAVGRTLTFVRGKGDTIQATVLSIAPAQYRLPNGLVTFTSPGEPLFPAESALIRSTPSARVTFESSRARATTEIAYVSQGVSWEAVYQAVLDGGQATVSGSATITSQSIKADSAMVQLVAGSINRARNDNAVDELKVSPGVMAMRSAPQLQGIVVEQAVGETHVYDLPGKISFDIGAPLTTALFPRARADVTQEFVVPGVLPWRGFFGPQSTDPDAVPVEVWYTFKRAHGTPFGDRPLPGGTIELFQRDSSGRVQLVGEAAFTHTPAGKDLRVQSGDAFDVTAERVQTDYNQEQLPAVRRGLPSRTRITASYSVTLTNAKPSAVTVDVRETHYGSWQVTASSVPAEKLSSTERRFRLSVPAGGTATLTYTLQVDS